MDFKAISRDQAQEYVSKYTSAQVQDLTKFDDYTRGVFNTNKPLRAISFNNSNKGKKKSRRLSILQDLVGQSSDLPEKSCSGYRYYVGMDSDKNRVDILTTCERKNGVHADKNYYQMSVIPDTALIAQLGENPESWHCRPDCPDGADMLII